MLMSNPLNDSSKHSDPTEKIGLFYNLRVERRGEVPRLVPTHHISLSLDEEGHRKFDGVRLVVVSDSLWDANGEPVVTDSSPTSYDTEEEVFSQHNVTLLNTPPKDPLKQAPSARTLYEAHRSEKEVDALLPPDRLVTVILELVAERREDLPLHEQHACFILTPLRHSLLLHQDKFTVLYDRNYAIEAPEYVRLVKLRCNLLYSRQASRGPYFLDHLADLTYHIRILALHPCRPRTPLSHASSCGKLPSLPPDIISQIVLRALDVKPYYQTDRYWAIPLLSYALIQKSWLHPVLDLFWDLIGSGRVPVLNLPGLIRCLKAQSERVQAVWRFEFVEAFWYTRYFGARYAENLTADAARGFFRTATELREVTVDYTFLREAMEALGALSRVEVLRVVSEQEDRTGKAFMPGALLSLCEVLKVAQKWSRLERLEINWWAEGRSEEDLRNVLVPYSLKDLRLIDGRLYGSELLHLTSQQPPTLTNLFLEGIWCLSNSQFREFLLRVRGTLENLELRGVEVEKVSEDEESALDSCISELRRLAHLTAPYGILTNRGIARKGTLPAGAILWVEDYICTAMWETPGDVGLAQAIEEGHWKEIHLTCSGHLQNYQVLTGPRYLQKQGEVMDVARREGIVLTLPILETAI